MHQNTLIKRNNINRINIVMKSICICFLSLLLMTAHVVQAETYTDNLIILEVPPGFDGPEFDNGIPYGVRVAYKKVHADKKKSALLQITSYNFGPKMPVISEEQSGAEADKYLSQFLKSDTNHFTSFLASRPKRINLAGYPAARISWSGNLDGRPTIGVMFCVIVKSRVLSFLAQDVKENSAADLNLAIDAINAVRFKYDPK
jgi:hypothetical protein